MCHTNDSIRCADTHTIILAFCTFKVNGGGSGGVWVREYRLREYSGHTLASSPGLPLAPHNREVTHTRVNLNNNNFARGGEGLGTRLDIHYTVSTNSCYVHDPFLRVIILC